MCVCFKSPNSSTWLSRNCEASSFACLALNPRNSILAPLALKCSSTAAANPFTFYTLTHTRTHTPTFRVLREHIALCMFTLNCLSAAGTHTQSKQSIWDILHGSSSVSAAGASIQLPCVLVRWASVGAGCDGFLQLQVESSRADLEAAEAVLTDPAGLEQLLAWHGDLLVATAGAEHVTAVPAGDTHRWVRPWHASDLWPCSYHAICGIVLYNNTEHLVEIWIQAFI